ncbi:hypothetical protein QR680_015176 [Steinernema hermaphroditum]|uniref:Cullin family profile domain-containing protein n=1 Tax=Steinernema hermaphroditum TaxID=289476 RepID=A0AA39ID06_9BILA|nr:hypothetical protein QR680_015176 [Steinernema hermaphroditum]
MAPKELTYEHAIENFMSPLMKVYNYEKLSFHEYGQTYSLVTDYCRVNSGIVDENRMIGGGRADVAYKALEDLLVSFVYSKAAEIGVIPEDVERLRAYKSAWDAYSISAKVVDGLFRYLNRHWVQRYNEYLNEHRNEPELAGEPKVFEAYTLCMIIWKRQMFENPKLDIVQSALELMKRERDGESVEVELVKRLVESLVTVGIEFRKEEDPVSLSSKLEEEGEDPDELRENELLMLQSYEKYFETPMLEATRQYYQKESAVVILSDNILAYMEKADQRLKEEEERCGRYLHDVLTNRRIQKAVDTAYIEDRLDVFQRQFLELLKSENYSDLLLMYKLCSRVEKAIDQLRKDFRDYVAEKGREAIANIPKADWNDPKTYVSTVLEVHKKYRDMVTLAFNDDTGFSIHFDEGCVLFVNKNAVTNSFRSLNKSAEHLAKFIDGFMRKGSTDDFEVAADRAMTFFMYIEDKDIFQKYYNRLLSKRLIMELSVNDDYERAIITRLKTACGHEYVNVSMKMFADIDTSKSVMHQFKEGAPEQKDLVDFNMQVLSTGCWPFKDTIAFEIPPVFQDITNAFTAFYNGLHSGRKLCFLYGNSRGEISARFIKKFMFVATTPQMTVLLKYNDVTVSTVSQLLAELRMPKDVLLSVLASLVKADLLKLPEGVEVTTSLPDDTELSLNQKYSSKRYKVDLMKFQTPLKGDTEALKREQKDMERMLEEDRKMVIQAAIVRIMKMRRCVRHNDFIGETVQQVADRFQPKISMIKKCIDLLMEKEYLKRSPEDKDTYEYIA